jgi:hypothetical protein
VVPRYERVTFEKSLRTIPGQPLAEFVSPGHPLLASTIDLTLERNRDLLRTGAILVGPADEGESIRALFYLEHSIQDARLDRAGNRRVISKQLQFIEVDANRATRNAGYAPYLDYRPTTPEESAVLLPVLEQQGWLTTDLEADVVSHAISALVPQHLSEVRARREDLILRTMAAVKDRLTKEIAFWDHRANQLKDQELAGKVNAKINSGKARQRADEIQSRLQKRMLELEQERQISPLPPVVIGGAVVIPAGLLRRVLPARSPAPELAVSAEERKRIEMAAMQAVMLAERRLGFEPHDVSAEKCGDDIESRVPGDGRLRFIEVKGRTAEAETVTVTYNEVLTALNKPNDFILAIAQIDGGRHRLHYVRNPFAQEPEFSVESINYKLKELLDRAELIE